MVTAVACCRRGTSTRSGEDADDGPLEVGNWFVAVPFFFPFDDALFEEIKKSTRFPVASRVLVELSLVVDVDDDGFSDDKYLQSFTLWLINVRMLSVMRKGRSGADMGSI